MPHPVFSWRLKEPPLPAQVWPARSVAGKATSAPISCLAGTSKLSGIMRLTSSLVSACCSATA
eukprot:5269740-Pyramimonas_sp.AAC.1